MVVFLVSTIALIVLVAAQFRTRYLDRKAGRELSDHLASDIE